MSSEQNIPTQIPPLFEIRLNIDQNLMHKICTSFLNSGYPMDFDTDEELDATNIEE